MFRGTQLVADERFLVLQPDFATLSETAAATVLGTRWDDAGATVDAIFRRALAVDVPQKSYMACP